MFLHKARKSLQQCNIHKNIIVYNFQPIYNVYRTIDWCACSPNAVRHQEYLHMKKVVQMSPRIFFARKFDSSIDMGPVNDLELTLGGMNGDNIPGLKCMKLQ